MSIEQTLQNIADALLKVAESNHAIAAASLKTEESYRASIGAYAAATAARGEPLKVTDTTEQDVTRVETDAKAEQKKVMAMVEADRKPAANAKAAIAEALELAKKADADKKADFQKKLDAGTAAVQAQVDAINDPLDAAPLDWDKDVRPALLAVGKDRDALVKLMGKYEVPKGGKAPAEKWADLLAEANAIAAARG